MSSKNEMMQDLLYMQLLQPDEGYQVDFAVGCTFSLNMDGLIAMPLALSGMGDAKTLSEQNAMYVMEGILRCSEKFVLFCNKGFIHAPANCQPLHSLMENSVVEVFNSVNPLANFHPKMWVIRLKPKESNAADVIKLIVMSRNLTFTKELDVVLAVKGKVNKGESYDKNKPVANFLRNLAVQYDKNNERKKKIEILANDFESVERFDFESPLSSKVYELHPTLFGSKYNGFLLKRLQGKRVLIISPFLDTDSSSGIAMSIIEKTEKKYLVTRDNNVTQDVLGIFDKVYVPNSIITDDESNPVDLHAKMYLVEQGNDAVYLYLGSANATHSAFERNAEMTIGIRVNDYTFDQMFDELVNRNELYIPVSEPIVDAEQEKERRKIEGDLEHVMRWAMSSLASAKITKKQNDSHYQVDLKYQVTDKKKYQIDECSDDYRVRVRPLQCINEWKELDRKKMNLQWELELDALSEFYVVEAQMESDPSLKKSGVCKVETNGLQRFWEERKEKIVNKIVNQDNVLQYIDMILSDFPEYTFEKWNQRRTQTGMTTMGNSGLWDGVAIYEQLLKASYENPSKLDELKKVLPNLPENEYPEGLKSILDAFGITVKRKKNQ